MRVRKFLFPKIYNFVLEIVRNNTIQYISQFLDVVSTSSERTLLRSTLRRPWGGTNETKIKCKWKFIAPGDGRRFLTFKFFINFSAPWFFFSFFFLSFFSLHFSPSALNEKCARLLSIFFRIFQRLDIQRGGYIS